MGVPQKKRNYVTKALKQFQHKVRKLQHAPYPSAPIQYGAKKQYATQKSSAPLVDAKTKKFIQQPTSMRQVSIPGPSSRQHTTLSHKRYSITIISTYHRDIGEHDETTRLPRIAGGGCTIIPCERHDRLCAQRRKLLKQAKHAVEREDTSSCPVIHPYLQTMGQY